MQGEELLYLKNNSVKKKTLLRHNMMVYEFRGYAFDGVVIKDIISFVNKVKNINMPIYFDLGQIEFKDKLAYIFFECICNHLITKYNKKILLTVKIETTIDTLGVDSSPLKLLNLDGRKSLHKHLMEFREKTGAKYKDSFEKEIYGSHYRRILRVNEDSSTLSLVMGEIDSFLKFFSIDEIYRDAISEVVVELAGNAIEHGESDCLIDIDVTDDHKKRNVNGIYYGVNIAVVNFSGNLLGSSIKKKIKQEHLLNERHKMLIEAYKLHSESFNSDYGEEDFYNVASFQHKISGRLKKETTGGTGLKTLISRLEHYSDAYLCYVISGNRAIFFEKDYLKYNKENWIGFNDENDFLGNIPKKDFIGKSHVFMPGTAYNLNFVLKKEE